MTSFSAVSLKEKRQRNDWKHKNVLIVFDIKIINQWHCDWEPMSCTIKAVY